VSCWRRAALWLPRRPLSIMPSLPSPAYHCVGWYWGYSFLISFWEPIATTQARFAKYEQHKEALNAPR